MRDDDASAGDRGAVNPALNEEAVRAPDEEPDGSSGQDRGTFVSGKESSGRDEPEGSAKSRTSFGNDPGRQGTN
jgi:hypothetical protein